MMTEQRGTSTASDSDDDASNADTDSNPGGEGATESQDHYGRTDENLPRNENQSTKTDDGSPFAAIAGEPADPTAVEVGNLPDRESTPLASRNFDPTNLPAPFVQCGCGECLSMDDPLADSGVPEAMAIDTCPEPMPVSVGKSGEIYRAYAVAETQRPDWTDRRSRARNRYRRVMNADRRFRREFDLTTVLLSLRLSPITDDGRWHSSLRLDTWLHEPASLIRKALRYQIKRKRGLDYEYVTVTAGTSVCATPHRHILLWIDDPHDKICAEMFSDVIDKHVTKVPTAYSEDHEITEGRGGAVSVETDPSVHLSEHRADSAEYGHPQTLAATYVATQLPHLDALQGENNSVANQTAAVCWCSPYNWFSASRGV